MVFFDSESLWEYRQKGDNKPKQLRWLIFATMTGLILHIPVEMWIRRDKRGVIIQGLGETLPEDFMQLFFYHPDPNDNVCFVGNDVRRDIMEAFRIDVGNRFIEAEYMYDGLVRMGVNYALLTTFCVRIT